MEAVEQRAVLLVCGSRDWQDRSKVNYYVKRWITRQRDRGREPVVVSGGARGVDTTAENTAERNDCAFLRVPAQWDRYGKKAGHIRNSLMLSLAKDLASEQAGALLLHAMAFHQNESRGTADMIRKLEASAVKMKVYSSTIRD